MIDTSFYGQQEGERILYEAHPDKFGFYLAIGQIGGAAVLLLVIMAVIMNAFPTVGPVIAIIGLVLGILLLVAGIWVITSQSLKNVTYITDRRVIRFIATSPWAVNSRSLFWDEVVKIKTFSTSWFMKMMNVGSIVVHARTNTMRSDPEGNSITSDDLQINDVSYYADLGNYLDKILYLYKKEPDQLKALRPFVPKPKGQRY